MKRKVKHSYYIEPTSLTRKSAILNFAFNEIQQRVSIVEGGLGSSNEVRPINLSKSRANNSFLTPDELPNGLQELVQLYTIDYLFEKFKIDDDKVFFKLEAEGFELEILKGMIKRRPSIISVDITPEMNNLSPFELIKSSLLKKGYELLKCSSRVAFFKYKK